MALGNLYIVSAPSGAGKSSLIAKLLATEHYKAQVSISHTSRTARVGEEEAKHYYFTSKDEFEQLIKKDMFLEYATVFGNYYGTSKQMVNLALEQGIDVFLDIDWQGARQVRKQVSNCKSIFIFPPSLAELEKRLVKRGQDSQEVIAARMAKAQAEMEHYVEYDYIIVNDSIEQALADLQAIVQAEKLNLSYQQIQHKILIAQLLAKE